MNTVHRSAARAARHGIISAAVLAFAVVSGCAVGPDYRAPELTVPARYSESAVGASAGTSLAEWWRVFHDGPLDRLVARAIDANLDLRIAEARVRESRALRGIARSALWPTVDGGAAIVVPARARTGPWAGRCGAGSCPSRPISTRRRSMRVWEIDIFGGTRRALESAEAEIARPNEARRDILVSLLGEVGSSYIEVRGLQQELAVSLPAFLLDRGRRPAERGGQRFLHRRQPFLRTRSRHPLANLQRRSHP